MDSSTAGELPGAALREDYLARLSAADTTDGRIELTAEWVLRVFERFYAEFLRLTWLAKDAFESRNHAMAVANARRRLQLYNATVYPLAEEVRSAFPELAEDTLLWRKVEA